MYILPGDANWHDIILVAFAVEINSDSSKLCCTAQIVFGKLQKDAVIHFLTWESHKFRPPVSCTTTAEISATGEDLDEMVSVRTTLSVLFETSFRLAVMVNSMGLYK